MKLTAQILYCLEQYPYTRNNDIDLTIRVWRCFPPVNENNGNEIKIIHSEKTGKDYISVDDLHWLQREDHIKRIRAKIQNKDEMWLPSDPEVIKARRQEEIVWRNRLGYRTKVNKDN